MIAIPTAEQEAFQGSSPKNLVLEFPIGRVLANQDIVTESMELEQTICDESNLTFGMVYSSCFSVRIFDDGLSTYTGLRIFPRIDIEDGNTTYTRRLGYFTVKSDKITADKLHRDLKCYDALSDVLTLDYSQWHNSRTTVETIKSYRDAFFSHIGIEQVLISLPNDNVTVDKFTVTKVSGAQILSAILQLNGAFGYIGYDGRFKYVLTKTTPDYTIDNNSYVQGTLDYEDEPVKQISGVTVKGFSDDYGEEGSQTIADAVSGNSQNSMLIIEDNYLIHACSLVTRQTICTNLYNALNGYTYYPTKVEFPVYIGLELGDVFQIATGRKTIQFPVLRRSLKGINALRDSFEANGETEITSNANSVGNSINTTQMAVDQIKLSVSRILAGKVSADQLDVISGRIEILEADSVTVNNTLYAHAADIETLSAEKADVVDLDVSNARINELEVGYGTISELEASYGNIHNLLSGNAGVGDLQNIHLTTLNADVDEAVIKNLVTQYISVNDLMASTIDTSKFRIASPDGAIVIEDNVQSFKDANGNTRIQMGQDALGNFTFVLYDETGTGVIIDSEGLKDSGISDGLIKDRMVADDASIQGSKLDIASVFDALNRDGTHTFSSSKIYLDEYGQTLTQGFQNITNAATGLDTRVSVIETGIDGLNVSLIETQTAMDSVAAYAGFIYQAITSYSSSDSVTIRSYVYRGEKDITSQFPTTWFSYHKKDESGFTQLGTGYTISLNRSSYDYLGSVVCRFNIPDEGNTGDATDDGNGNITMSEDELLFKALTARDNMLDGNVQLYYKAIPDKASNVTTCADDGSGNVTITIV